MIYKSPPKKYACLLLLVCLENVQPPVAVQTRLMVLFGLGFACILHRAAADVHLP